MDKKRLLIIGWEGADWRFIQKYVDDGVMPHLSALIEKSTIGKIHSVEPNMATTLWASLFTGKRPHKHGVIGLKEYDDKISHLKPITKESRKCSDIFEILEHSGYKVHTVGLSTSHPAYRTKGISISNEYTRNELSINNEGILSWPLSEDSIYPAEQAEIYAKFRVHHSEINEILSGHIASISKIKTPEEIFIFNKIIADNLSINSVATYLLENEDWDVCAINFNGLERVCSRFIDNPVEVLKDNSELVAYLYKLFDFFLESLTEFISENDTLVIASEYGYSPIRIRNKPRKWDKGLTSHDRNNGFFLIGGRDIKKDLLINNLSILDITPTILASHNLAIGEDMDGHVCQEIFENQKDINNIETWENQLHKYEIYPKKIERILLEINNIIWLKDPIYDRKMKNYYYWLSKSLIDGRELKPAIRVLEMIHLANPDDQRIIFLLSKSYDATNQSEKSIEVLSQIKEDNSLAKIRGLCSKAKTLIQNKKIEDAIITLISAEVLSEKKAAMLSDIGIIYMNIHRWDSALRLLKKSLALQPLDYQSLSALGRAYLQNQDFEKALNSFNESISIKQYQPHTHYYKAETLIHLCRYNESVNTLEVCLNQNSQYRQARLLALNTYKNHLRNVEKYHYHLSIFNKSMRGVRRIISCGDISSTKEIKELMEQRDINISRNFLRPQYTSQVINRIVGNAEKSVTLSIPGCLFHLMPQFNYSIVHIKPDINKLDKNQISTKIKSVKQVINNTERRIREWITQHPNMSLLVLDEEDFHVDNTLFINKIVALFSKQSQEELN